MFVLKEFLSKEVYENLENVLWDICWKFVSNYKWSIRWCRIRKYVYGSRWKVLWRTYELTKIIIKELAYGSHINIYKFIERNKVIKKVRRCGKSYLLFNIYYQ